MGLLPPSELAAAEAISKIGYVNPFLPERMELEERALGRAFRKTHAFIQFRPDAPVEELFPNFIELRARAEHFLKKMSSELQKSRQAGHRELLIYEDLALYVLYSRYMSHLLDAPSARIRWRPMEEILRCYDDFCTDFQEYLGSAKAHLPSEHDVDVIFAGQFQIERAFVHVFHYIVGGSEIAAQLRAEIWQSIFTHDMRHYARGLYRHMGNIPTLITGPTGTGKELIARAIALSRFIEFDPAKRCFSMDFNRCFVGLNLSAISPALIESELFGHAKGAFTGASAARAGYFDETIATSTCSVFLDEIGELDPTIQVKLLRVLQTREYQRVGESQSRPFKGKIIAATNRDLDLEMQAGRFRADLYYRLCADRIHTPSLRAQLQEDPEDLHRFVRFIAGQLLPDMPEEADVLTDEAVAWIHRELSTDYAWPGNIRELEQCVRGVMIRGSYSPANSKHTSPPATHLKQFLADVETSQLTRDELLRRYASLTRSRSSSDVAAARKLAVDRRTFSKLVDPGELANFRGEADHGPND